MRFFLDITVVLTHLLLGFGLKECFNIIISTLLCSQQIHSRECMKKPCQQVEVVTKVVKYSHRLQIAIQCGKAAPSLRSSFVLSNVHFSAECGIPRTRSFSPSSL